MKANNLLSFFCVCFFFFFHNIRPWKKLHGVIKCMKFLVRDFFFFFLNLNEKNQYWLGGKWKQGKRKTHANRFSGNAFNNVARACCLTCVLVCKKGPHKRAERHQVEVSLFGVGNHPLSIVGSRCLCSCWAAIAWHFAWLYLLYNSTFPVMNEKAQTAGLVLLQPCEISLDVDILLRIKLLSFSWLTVLKLTFGLSGIMTA